MWTSIRCTVGKRRLHASSTAVWLYESLWCKLHGRAPQQLEVVGAVPLFSQRAAGRFLLALGTVETALALWIISGFRPGLCAVTQTALLLGLNSAGILWARSRIHDPAGMVLKNVALLRLAWVGAALQKGTL